MANFLGIGPLTPTQQFQQETMIRAVVSTQNMDELKQVCIGLIKQNAQQHNMIKNLLKAQL